MPTRSLFFILFLFTVFAVAETKSEGYLRLGIQNHHQSKTYSDVALGGKLKINSPKLYGMSVSAAFYTSNALIKAANEGVAFYGSQNKNITLLGEAYLDGVYKDTHVKIGRQVIDTPFADSDDIGMIPNLFEAVTVTDSSLKDSILFFSYVNKMAGIDASKMESFSKFDTEDKVLIAGMIYDGFSNLSLEGWYYDINSDTDIIYLQTFYEGSFRYGDFTLGAQYANENFEGEKRAKIWGLMSEITHRDSGLSFSVAYDKTFSRQNASAENFFGGGSFFSSGEHLTISDAGEDGKVLILGVSYDASVSGIKNLFISLSNLWLKGDREKEMNEVDFTVAYELASDLTLDLIYSDIDDKMEKNNSFKNFRAYINYIF